nr:hypothetical protein [Leisingera sp. ANG-S]
MLFTFRASPPNSSRFETLARAVKFPEATALRVRPICSTGHSTEAEMA